MNKTKPDTAKPTDDHSNHAVRETIESVVVAVILAFLLRSFLVEPFVIPTGSMAPTLMGRHKDVTCEKCGHDYLTGASSENEDARDLRTVIATVCPVCRYRMVLNPSENANQATFNGDRIVVSKFAYDLNDPKRWDVIVFKFPGSGKQNYIKRLVGLPGEQLMVRHGDVFVRTGEDQPFTITRKPADKLPHIMQTVHDSNFVPESLIQAGWPARWSGVGDGDASWEGSANQSTFTLTESTSGTAWLRYLHAVPDDQQWAQVENSLSVTGMEHAPSLITDYYENNDVIFMNGRRNMTPYGHFWVGDIALECEIQVQDGTGVLALDIVEAGRHHTCEINVADGSATLKISNGSYLFDAGTDGEEIAELTADTAVRGPGSYDVRYANVDDQLLLWINNRLVTWQANGQPHHATYQAPEDERPVWSAEDPGDLRPIGVGGRGLTLTVKDLRVLRDVYYVATDGFDEYLVSKMDSYRILRSPEDWSTTELFDKRNAVYFPAQGVLGPDEFFPMGDNSPFSKDARLWTDDNRYGADGQLDPVPGYVRRDLLIGKAFMVYWPHPWNLGGRLPIIPNVQRMKRIR
ncbi:MAG: signal peptidase I [Planctomycetales bacterium]|nr:signal peptidase I [Planctomycetales bacterium]